MKKYAFLSVLFLLASSVGMAQQNVVRHKSSASKASTQSGAKKTAATASFSTKHLSDETFTVNGVSFVMKGVQGGTFTMGKTQDQICPEYKDYRGNMPKHQVSLSSFRIGQTEVTQELWQAVMGNNPVIERDRGSRKPVNCVSWYDCQRFISKLNELTGRKFRLPTEAEWEYAARGGNKSRHYTYSGSNNLEKVTNPIGTGEYKDDHYEVALNAPNELGIYDMTGNVYEWTADWNGPYSARAQVNPKGPKSGRFKVIRGGSTSRSLNQIWFWYVSHRYSMSPDSNVQSMLGFRLAM